jgi:outer membrane protein assembly factor BamB
MKQLTRLALHLCIAATASAGNWPGWRGPEGTGVSLETDLPETWSANQNVRWRVPLPGPGNSSAIAWGNRVWIAQAIKSQKRRTVICFDRAEGRQLWQAGPIYDQNEPTHENNPYCSATPVTDGERVVASFGSAGLYCYDLEGKELWHRDFGPMNHMFGNASSPVLHANLCILNFGPDPKARLIAVDKRDGHTLWEAEPPKVDPGEQPPAGGGPGAPGGGPDPGGPAGSGAGPPGGAWGTPLLIKAGQRDELVMNFPNRLAGYEPRTGKQLWFSKGIDDWVFTTPLSGGGVVVGMSSGTMGGTVLAAQPGGNGDVTESRRLWRLERLKSQSIGSGVIHDGYVYLIGEGGIASCLELKTGNKVWEERLKGPGAKSSSWSSMLLAGGRVYVPNQSGDVFVLRAGPRFELLATNSVNEPTNASLAASDGDLFLRTDRGLWCLAGHGGGGASTTRNPVPLPK